MSRSSTGVGFSQKTNGTSSSKKFWKGVFNYRCQMFVLYGWAVSEKKAWVEFCRRMAKQHGVNMGVVTVMFNGSSDNYRIEEEIYEPAKKYGRS